MFTLEQARALADKANVKYHPASKTEKILNDIKETIGEEAYNTLVGSTQVQITEEEKAKRIEKLKHATFDSLEKENASKRQADNNREAMRLVRCIITCNNKNKTSYTGEIFTVRNKLLEVKKFVSFGVPTHIPQILYNMIKEKQYQMFRKEKLSNGNVVTRPYMINEYNIQLLDPLSPSEYEAIRQKQLAEGKNNA